jgi:hypothetical protein
MSTTALVSAEGSLDVEKYNKAKEPLRDFLRALKAIHEDGAHFFVTGITPVVMAGESIWNSADHLTFHTEFADMVGLTRVDVEAKLRQVAKIKDEEELQRALEVATSPTPSRTSSTRRWLSSLWSSTARRSSAIRSVMTKACAVTLPGCMMDDNQDISERQARLVASHDSLRVPPSSGHTGCREAGINSVKITASSACASFFNSFFFLSSFDKSYDMP